MDVPWYKGGMVTFCWDLMCTQHQELKPVVAGVHPLCSSADANRGENSGFDQLDSH